MYGSSMSSENKTKIAFIHFLSQEFLPDLYKHFQAENFNTSMYASSWFLTLFTNQFPLNIVCRVMDLFLSEVIE